MRYWMFALLLLLASNARAQSAKILGEPPETLRVIVCPGRAPELERLREWRESKNFVPIADDRPGSSPSVLERVRQLSPEFSDQLSLLWNPKNPPKEIVISNDGEPDPQLVPAPRFGEACALRPMSVDVRRRTSGISHLVSARFFNALTPLEQELTRAMLAGVSAEALRVVLDQSTYALTSSQRMKLFFNLGVPTIVQDDVELKVHRPSDADLASPWIKRAYLGPDSRVVVEFNDEGHVMTVGDSDQFYTQVRRTPGSPLVITKTTPSGSNVSYITCARAYYRYDGQLAVCDKHYFDTQGLLISSTFPVVEITEKPREFFPGTERYYRSELPRHLVIFNSQKETRSLVSKYVNAPMTSLTLVTGDTSCAGASFQNTRDPNYSSYLLTLTVPGECYGVFRVSWGSTP